MAGVDSLGLAVHEAELKRLALGQSGELEPHNGAAIGETGLVMDVRGVSGFFRCAGDLEDAAVEIGHFYVRYAVGGGTLPAVANGLHSVASLLAFEGVLEDQGAFVAEPGRVGRGRGGGQRDRERNEEVQNSFPKIMSEEARG